ncbi:MAG TPA: hypothetical protein VF487_03390 [Chitinophagaceae bacterium]
MKNNLLQKFIQYLYSNFLGNFIGFAVGMASTRLVSHFFATRSIKNLWGLTSHKTMLDKKTYNNLEWIVSVVIGFIVFEIISKWVQKKMNQRMTGFKTSLLQWLTKNKVIAGIRNRSNRERETLNT